MATLLKQPPGAATAKSNPYRAILSGYLAPFWRRALLLLVLLLAGAGLLLLIPRILAAFIDAALQGSEPASLLGLGALFLGIAIGNQAITIATNYLGADIGLRATNQLRADLTLHCLELDMAFHHSITPGVLIERIDGDVTRLNQFLSTFAVLLIKNALLIVGALAVLFAVDWRVGAAITAFVLLTLALLEISRRVAVPSNRHEREASAQLFGLVEERLSGTEDVRANGGVAYVMRRFTERSREWARAFLWAHALSSSTWPLTSVLFICGLALSLGLAAWLLPIGVISIGAAYAIYRYVELMREPIRQIGRQVQDLQQAGAAIVRVQELLAQHSAIHDAGTAPLPALALDVAFHGVTFAYPTTDGLTTDDRRPTTDDELAADDGQLTYTENSKLKRPEGTRNSKLTRPSALHDLSFQLPAGQVLGLLGRSGSGKSTLARLLFRLYEPAQGTILLNGLALPAISLAALRERVGLVTQDVQLFNASVRDNLVLFEPDIDDARLLAALRAVELADWYESLPQGLDSLLPAGGGGMSAGQAQLLAFARMLLKDPGLVILDEASSRLDPITEQRLDHALDRLLAGRTAIIIAHRLATVQRADWIMILDGGRCVEFGPRVALMNDPRSQFARLLRAGLEEVLA